MSKPLRVYWMNDQGQLYSSNVIDDDNNKCIEITHDLESLPVDDYFVIICWNPSQYKYDDMNNSESNEETTTGTSKSK